MEGYLKEVNLEKGMPLAEAAIRRMTFELRNGKALGATAIKFIHGYGSSGKGGKIRIESRRYLESQKRKGLIKFYIEGERFSIFDEETRRAFDLCGELRKDSDLERYNNGITIVVL
jgi:hypothetical protein